MRITKPGMVAVGGGLYERTKTNGSRYWVFRWRDRVTSKLRDRGIGPATKITKPQAVRIAKGYAARVAEGGDPIKEARAKIEADRIAKAKDVTFGECCTKYIDAHSAGWRNAKHAAQWTTTLETYCAKLLPLPVAAIDTAMVLNVLEPIWSTKNETASRVRMRMENVMDWAAAREYRAGDNPARWRGHLAKLLPKPAKVKRVQHRRALPHAEIGDFMVELRKRDLLTARALELQVLCASRPGEVAGAQWAEIDMRAAVWTIPADRIKAGREHRVPLSALAVALLKALPRIDEHVFPGMRSHITTDGMLKCLHTIRDDLDAHGFRSTFRDWCSECTGYSRETAERALAHVTKDKSEAAYFRSDLFDKRRRMMEDWARYCGTPSPKHNVTSIRRKAS